MGAPSWHGPSLQGRDGQAVLTADTRGRGPRVERGAKGWRRLTLLLHIVPSSSKSVTSISVSARQAQFCPWQRKNHHIFANLIGKMRDSDFACNSLPSSELEPILSMRVVYVCFL